MGVSRRFIEEQDHPLRSWPAAGGEADHRGVEQASSVGAGGPVGFGEPVGLGPVDDFHDLVRHQAEHLVDRGSDRSDRRRQCDGLGRGVVPGGGGESSGVAVRWLGPGHRGDGVVPGGGVRLTAAPVPGVVLLSDRSTWGEVLVRVLGEAGRGVGLAVCTDPGRRGRQLPAVDQHLPGLGDQLSAGAQFLGEPAIGPVVMEPELDLDRASTFGTGHREPVEQVDARDEVERVAEGPRSDLGRHHPPAQLHRRGVAMEPVGQEPASFDLEDGHRGHPLPGLGVTLDREVVEPVPQVQVGVEDQVVDRHVANIHHRLRHQWHRRPHRLVISASQRSATMDLDSRNSAPLRVCQRAPVRIVPRASIGEPGRTSCESS